jgi:hypothetical protein
MPASVDIGVGTVRRRRQAEGVHHRYHGDLELRFGGLSEDPRLRWEPAVHLDEFMRTMVDH